MPGIDPNRVFILGAGFSKPAGFPLATELTDELLESLRSIVGGNDDLFELADHVRRLHKWLEQSQAIPALNVEEFYECASACAERLRLEQHRVHVGRDAGETPYAGARDVMTWLSYLDEHLLEVLLEHERDARLDAIHRFASVLRPGDAVITFNYDTLVERCLTSRGQSWSFGISGEQPAAVHILKMHGSLDWICYARGHRPERPGVVLLFSKKDENRERSQDPSARTGEEEYDFELCHIQDRKFLSNQIEYRSLIQRDHRWGLAGLGPQKRPSIVPGLGIVWEHARHALYRATTIIVVGFSFSLYDRLAQIELARVAMSRDESRVPAPRVVVIDPSLRSVDGQTPSSGRELLHRIEAVFHNVEPVGAFHEEFDWREFA